MKIKTSNRNKSLAFTLAEVLIAKRESGKMNLFKLSRTRELKAQPKKAKKLCAFTLAEVLITLGIIGVVAAMTIPTLINQTNDAEFKSAWKKEYSMLQQVIAQIYADEGQTYNYTDYPDHTYTPKYFCKMIKRMNVTKAGLDCSDEDNPVQICTQNGTCYWHHKNEYKTISGSLADHNGYFDRNTALLADGSLVRFDSWDNFWVDVNGFKKPNVIGKDIYYFRIAVDGSNKATFWGQVDGFNSGSPSFTTITQANYLTDCTSGTGWGCSAKVILGQ